MLFYKYKTWLEKIYSNNINLIVLYKKILEINEDLKIWTSVNNFSTTVFKDEGKLKNILYDLKSNIFCISSLNNDASSQSLLGYKPPFNSTIYDRIKSEGGILIGKTNCDEFARGSQGQTSYYSPTKLYSGKQTGGSSSGAAVSASRYSHFSIGTDTGGSCRFPVLKCGNKTIGFKPSYGAVSLFGVVSYAPSLDTIGIISRDIDVIEKVYDVLKGCDNKDCVTFKTQNKNKLQKYKILIFDYNNMYDEQKIFIEGFKKLDYIIMEKSDIKLDINLLNSVYEIISSIEFFSSTNKYNSFFHSQKTIKSDELENIYINRYSMFHKETIIKQMKGALVLSSQKGREIYYKTKQKRYEIILAIRKILEEYDIIILPSHSLNQKENEESYYLIANLVGIPSITIPLTAEEGGPGLNIMSNINCDFLLLDFIKKILCDVKI